MPEDEAMRSLLQGGYDTSEEARFRYEIIRGLAESIREMAKNMAEMQKTQVTMLERLAKLEASRFGEEVVKIEGRLNGHSVRINNLEQDKDKRDGAAGLLGWLLKYGPLIFSMLAALWLYGRSFGVVPAPALPTPVVLPSAPSIQPERRSEK